MTNHETCSGQQFDWALIKKLGEGDAGEVYLAELAGAKDSGYSGQFEPGGAFSASGSNFPAAGPAGFAADSPQSPAEQPAATAILKRPRRSPFTGEVIRQSSQIDTEGKILKVLAHGLADTAGRVRVPALLDRSWLATENSDRYFIVIEQAPGFDLGFLARVALMGREAIQRERSAMPGLSVHETFLYLEAVARSRRVPAAVVLCVLDGLFDLFEQVHNLRFQDGEKERAGILWNDVKPDHLFWDPVQARLTVIDWGNGRFLEGDGTTEDRQGSADGDYRQLLDEMGRYLATNAPELKQKLKWPASFISKEELERLKLDVKALLVERTRQLKKARQRERALIEAGAPEAGSKKPRASKKGDPFEQLVEVQNQIVELGEMPDYSGALAFSSSYASIFIQQNRLDTLREVAGWAALIPDARAENWALIARLAGMTLSAEGETRRRLTGAVQAVVEEDWESVLWNLTAAFWGQPEPEGWYELSTQVRSKRLELQPGEILPVVSVKRTLLAVQAIVRQLEDQLFHSSAAPRSSTPLSPAPYSNSSRAAVTGRPAQNNQPPAAPEPQGESGSDRLATLRNLAYHLKEEVLPNWRRADPSPPHSGLAYSEIDALLPEIEAAIPDVAAQITTALANPKQQVELVLAAWKRSEFTLAAGALRLLLMWDPNRLRVFAAEKAILAAPLWLQKVQAGPAPGENLQDFATALELEGRDLRNQVGPASWLDLLLDTLKQLRRGAWPGDLLHANPALLRTMAWLERFERRERMPAQPVEPAQPAIEPNPSRWVIAEPAPASADADEAAAQEQAGTPPEPAKPALHGVLECEVGPGYDMEIGQALDVWVPEARGSSARVFMGHLKNEAGQLYPAALKLMRIDQVDYALPLFHEEVQILDILKDIPGVTPLVESGFIFFDNKRTLPPEGNGAEPATGQLIRIGRGQPQVYQDRLHAMVEQGWVPYLAIELRPASDNLLYMCDAGLRGGRFLPLTDLTRISIQICEIMQIAHERNIVYRDHKILHYYWDELNNGVQVIDWNVARYHPDGLSETEIHMDLVQFGARALHHILTGRTAPGALPLGPTRPEEIEQAATSYTTQWTYDDQRLTPELKEIIENTLAGSYRTARQLGQDLKLAYLRINE